jgi:hypothetical protein
MLMFQAFASKKAQEQVFQTGLTACTGLPTSKDVLLNAGKIEQFMADAKTLSKPASRPNAFV